MELNHETALRLWNNQFGKTNEACDYTGRKIMKAAYNQRNSKYGWNVDHILPESMGGKTTDANLICCHILTNDEKADKFPAFVANGMRFNAVKVQNHYEIRTVQDDSGESEPQNEEEEDEDINLFDSASGIRFFKDLKGIQNKVRWVGTVTIKLKNVGNTALMDFIDQIFDIENTSYTTEDNVTIITIRNYDVHLVTDVSDLLDKCILLNTYLGHYFLPMEYLNSYKISFDLDYYKDKREMYNQHQNQSYYSSLYIPHAFIPGRNHNLTDKLYINKLVYNNTEAKDKEPDADFDIDGKTEYDYYYTKLSKNLDKEVIRNQN